MAIISNATTIADAGAFSVSLGSMVHIKTLTASSSATLSFVDGADSVVLDSTYPIYKFEFINMHPATDQVNLTFNFSTDGGSNYNVAKTSATFNAIQDEGGSTTELGYNGYGLAQGTGFQSITRDIGADADQGLSGSMSLFNPASTTFVKHFIANVNLANRADYTVNMFSSGYGNTTSAVDAIQFKMSSGDIDDGKIKLYGIKDS